MAGCSAAGCSATESLSKGANTENANDLAAAEEAFSGMMSMAMLNIGNKTMSDMKESLDEIGKDE